MLVVALLTIVTLTRFGVLVGYSFRWATYTGNTLPFIVRNLICLLVVLFIMLSIIYY
jgi:hypothetical protein